jgi:hypothetical protein
VETYRENLLTTSIDLGDVLSVSACKAKLDAMTDWTGTAVYLLSNLTSGEPVYCGTANGKARLRSHLHKDDLLNGPLGKTMVNPELRAYCLNQQRGWLGIQFRLYPNEPEARAAEKAIITELGIRRQGGRLFNQRTSG